MTSLDTRITETPATQYARRVVVMHVVESWGAGVRAATIRYAAATPECEHHVLRGVGRSEFASDGEEVFASVRDLPSGALAARRAIRAATRELRPDVVHAQSSYAGVFVRMSLRSTSRQRIVYSPHCFAFERDDLSPLLRWAARAVETILARNTDTVATCSRAELATASRLGARAVYVPNVPSTGSPAAVTSTEGVVAVGRIGAQKDPGFYGDVVDLLRARRPAVAAEWVGDGDDTDARADLERRGIRVTGWLSSAGAQSAVAGAAVYVHTAAWEGFPISILEAVELGIPVVAREVPTLAGALATPGLMTPAHVADAVEALLAGGPEARERNLLAWRDLLAGNSAEQQAAALRELYSPAIPLAINGKWLGSRQSGMQRYAGEVARRILALTPDARVIAPANAVLPEWLPAERVTRSTLSGVPFEQLELPWRARGSMLLNLAGAAPLVKRDQLVVMHDVTPVRFPQTFSRRFVAWYSVMNRVLSRRARHLATVSEFSRSELADVLGVERFTVAPNGHEHMLDTRAPGGFARSGGLDYVLCIGNLTPNKNLVPVATALAAAGIPVVVVGAGGSSNVYARQVGLDIPGVELAGRVSDDELATLLRGAKALVFPSLYEGFGLPLVEAQALGCPVIASDAASIPEVAGDGALYFDARHPEQAVALVQALDADTRSTLVERGHTNVTRFSWDSTAATLLALATDDRARSTR
ncbi:MAG: glycosyltransferase [Salinibacterium sp.]|nr:glycosyltransferase [Salinibacterium sp.]